MNNLISDALSLSEKYASKLKQGLLDQGLNETDINTILSSIRLDSGVYLSNKPRYRQDTQNFRMFCDEYLHQDIANNLFEVDYLYEHQVQGIKSILAGADTIISAGTGSGKTETFLLPIIHHSRESKRSGIKAIIIYPMNALASDQVRRIGKYTKDLGVTFGVYVGSTPKNKSKGDVETEFLHQMLYRDDMIKNPPDILITNYVMLDWMLSRPRELNLFKSLASSLKYIVLDEVHVYRGSRAAHIKYLLMRLKHYCVKRPVHIATSATLIDKKGNKEQLDTFLKDLFSTSTIPQVIRASHSDVIQVLRDPMPDFLDISFDYDLTGRDAKYNVVRLFKSLTGKETSQSYYAHDKREPFYVTIRQNAFYQEVIAKISETGVNIDALIKVLHDLTNHQFNDEQARKIVIAYLDLFAYIDKHDKDGDPKLLEARVHLFIRDMVGNLRIDLESGQYIVTNEEYSPDSGNLIFPVDKEDIRVGIAKISDNRIKSYLKRESDDVRNTYFVRIAYAGSSNLGPTQIRIDIDRFGTIKQDSSGKFTITKLSETHLDQLDNRLIEPSNLMADYHYLHAVVNTLLEQKDQSRKLLAFIDNREQASRYSNVLKDEFASAFLYAFLGLHFQGLRRDHEFDVCKMLEELHKEISKLDAGKLETAVFDDLELWYWRFISIPERKGGERQLLKLKSNVPIPMTPLELEIINKIFLPERAISKPLVADDNVRGNYIRFQLWRALDHYGVHFHGDQSKDPKFHSLAISEQHNAIYADVVGERLDAIENSVLRLVDKGIVERKVTSDDKNHYYLKPEYVTFQLPEPEYRNYRELCENLLLDVAVHSSEVKDNNRKIIESRFQNSDDLQVVVATPTLEMGIDIGKLETVLLIGAPPLPSNYAQRAGRAGRSRSSSALIVTFCSMDHPHDMYTFNNPLRMINGDVAPPSFDPKNKAVIVKHIHAHLLRKQEFLSDLYIYQDIIGQELEIELDAVNRLVDAGLNVKDYLISEFPNVLAEIITVVEQTHKLGNSDTRKRVQFPCYQNGFFPDYFSQQGQIILIDEELYHSATKGTSYQMMNDDALTTRDIEQAFATFIPGQNLYIAGDIYRVLSDGKYNLLQDGAKQFDVMLATREIRFATRRKGRQKYEKGVFYTGKFDEIKTFGSGILHVALEEKCQLSFRNQGPLEDSPLTNHDDFPIGYDLERKSLLFSFDDNVCDEITQISFIAIISRTITEELGLEGDELRLILDAKNLRDEDKNAHILYDAQGNSNLPFEKMYKWFVEFIRRAYSRLMACTCQTDGCYQCVRSYSTQFLNSSLSRESATAFCAYLLGSATFNPSISQFQVPNSPPDLVLTVEKSGDMIRVESDNHMILERQIESSQNATIFKALTEMIEQEYKPYMRVLYIQSRSLGYLKSVINNRQVNKDKEAFNKLQFTLLNFETVEGH